MEAVFAEQMSDNNKKDGSRIFLAGDSAHAFPPSGGFGLNTGIGDANNLSHKIAFALQTNNSSLLSQYNDERCYASHLVGELALKNYEKSIKIAQKLFLSKDILDYTQKFVENMFS